MLNYIRTTGNPSPPPVAAASVVHAGTLERRGDGLVHYDGGGGCTVLVPCHGVGVVKWMNGIRAQELGGCLCDVLPGWTRLPSQVWFEWQIHTRTSTHANVQKPHEAYGVWIVSNTLMIIVITDYLFLINYILKLLVFPTKTGRYLISNFNRKSKELPELHF